MPRTGLLQLLVFVILGCQNLFLCYIGLFVLDQLGPFLLQLAMRGLNGWSRCLKKCGWSGPVINTLSKKSD
jgi:hypothetical protein